MSEVVIARVTSARDLDAVLDIEAASFVNPSTRSWYEGELQRPDVCYIYVLRTPHDGVAAFCAFWRVLDQIHINNLAVRPGLRRRGFARMLLARVLDDAATLGAPNATLEVRRSNEAARRLYEQAGFRLVAVRTSYYTSPIEDALILSRGDM